MFYFFSMPKGKKSLAPNPAEAPLVLTKTDTESWDDEADVVVVGFGGAGACAALEAMRARAGPVVDQLPAIRSIHTVPQSCRRYQATGTSLIFRARCSSSSAAPSSPCASRIRAR